MPPRSNPTARQVRLGTELKRLRERAGITAIEAARVVGVDAGKMSHIESGRAAVTEDRLRRLAEHLGVADAGLVDALVAMATERRRGWWEKYRELVHPLALDLAELEHHARGLRALQVIHIPGLLQCEGHARALFSNSMPDLSAQEVEAIVEFRMRRRRQIFDRDDPPRLDAVIHEAALRIRVGDRKLAREQLDLLLELSERPELSVRVVPFERDGFTETSFSMLYAEGPVQQLDAVQFDAVHGSIFVYDEKALSRYRTVLDAAAGASLSRVESRDLIRRIAREL
ncbi:DNA-binding protein [Streptomyces albireticuli]|uniref:DNA-binding protein n=1 Tax=Streptomyces albireticuli TaxID=1940 RepID=A0A1Z2L4K8_9ACTN|nr:helix-turn-helix transcriptional regulator [Streptomyces albireticuli]ARZ69216.1 DNA-binding protein [Streptomyces albireticuli]